MEILQVENLSFRYPNAEDLALSGVAFSVRSGEFLAVCGASGCGKTTLLRLLKAEVAPVGEKTGSVTYADGFSSAFGVGYVFQNPDSGIVTDTVWHELAFGLENKGVPTEVIRRRVGETASYFGIQDWFRKRTDELSGGQKQLLNLAAAVILQPSVLILDEPTAQLDPIAATEFLATLQKLNRELGMTVLLAEHRLEEVFPIADRVLVMDGGRVAALDEPAGIGERLPSGHPMQAALPSPVRIFRALEVHDRCPLTVREGRDFLERHFGDRRGNLTEEPYRHGKTVAAEMKTVWYRYEKGLPDVLRGTSLRVYEGELFAVLGGNGTGKTTMLRVLAGLSRAYRGHVRIFGKPIGAYKGNALYRGVAALLPQDPQTVFVRDTVRDDLTDVLEAQGRPRTEWEERIDRAAERSGIGHLLGRNPFDLSGGEAQKCALAKILLTKPRLLLLDEPTKGIDADGKRALSELLRGLCREGMTVLTVTHDVEFAAVTADRCALFFDGELLSEDTPSRFFGGNSFYTTAANRMARTLCPNAVTCDQVVRFCRGEDLREDRQSGAEE